MPRKKTRKATRSPMVMHTGEKARDLQARMKWLLGFLNTDIDSLNPIGSLQLYLDFLSFLHGYPPLLGISKKMERIPETDLIQVRRFLKKGQDELRWLLAQILMTANMDDEFEMRFLPNFHTYKIEYHVVVTEDRVFKVSHLHSPIDCGMNEVGIYTNLEPDSVNLARDFLANALIEVLNPFPLSRIKTCQKPDCGKYFYQKTTKSKGDFCSPRCRNWANVNRWRENNRDKYNKYHRGYYSERRDKAKQDRVEVKCPSCGHRRSKGSLSDYLKGHSFEEDCPQCEKAKLLHIVTRWDKSERSWIPEEYTFIDWKNYLRGIQKGEE